MTLATSGTSSDRTSQVRRDDADFLAIERKLPSAHSAITPRTDAIVEQWQFDGQRQFGQLECQIQTFDSHGHTDRGACSLSIGQTSRPTPRSRLMRGGHGSHVAAYSQYPAHDPRSQEPTSQFWPSHRPAHRGISRGSSDDQAVVALLWDESANFKLFAPECGAVPACQLWAGQLPARRC